MSAQTAPTDLQADPADRAPALGARLAAVRDRYARPVAPEGWLLLGGVLLSMAGLLVTTSAWPSIVDDEFGSVIEGSAAWSAVGIAIASIGGLMCVAAAAAYGVLLGQDHATRGADRA